MMRKIGVKTDFKSISEMADRGKTIDDLKKITKEACIDPKASYNRMLKGGRG